MRENVFHQSGNATVDAALEILQDKKAEDITIFNPGEKSTTADWFILCQGTAEVHNRAMAEAIIEKLETIDSYLWHSEGTEQGRWVVLDYVDVVIMIMTRELRRFYDFETLWKEYPATAINHDRE